MLKIVSFALVNDLYIFYTFVPTSWQILDSHILFVFLHIIFQPMASRNESIVEYAGTPAAFFRAQEAP